MNFPPKLAKQCIGTMSDQLASRQQLAFEIVCGCTGFRHFTQHGFRSCIHAQQFIRLGQKVQFCCKEFRDDDDHYDTEKSMDGPCTNSGRSIHYIFH